MTPLGALLGTDVEGSLRHRAVVIGELEYPAWGALLDGMRGGAVAFESVFGESCYDRLSAAPDLEAAFDRSMTVASA